MVEHPPWLLHAIEDIPEPPKQIYKPFKTSITNPAEIRTSTQECLQDLRSTSFCSDFLLFEDHPSSIYSYRLDLSHLDELLQDEQTTYAYPCLEIPLIVEQCVTTASTTPSAEELSILLELRVLNYIGNISFD